MILTRSWLSEFVSLDALSDQALADTFVSIGHEVASFEKTGFDAQVVVGKVIACEKHPDADKLNVCQVNVGEKIVQIVCGAKNVAAGQFVPVALPGAKLPGGLEIKEAELRGVKSGGMICSAKELGLPDLGEGILELDASIGELTAGWKLESYPVLADTVFELELTANRGDCLSVYGIARDLAAALEVPMAPDRPDLHDQNAKGIGRILQLVSQADVTASVMIKAIENNGFKLPLSVRARLAMVQMGYKQSIDALIAYATHTTGVLFRAYDIGAFRKEGEERGVIRLQREGAFNRISGLQLLSRPGLDMDKSFAATDESPLIVLEAFFVEPDEVSKAAWENKLGGDELHGKACKGSEPELGRGMRFFYDLLGLCGRSLFFSEALAFAPVTQPRSIAINTDELCALIGQTIDKNRIAALLKRLGAKMHVSGDQNSFALMVPAWRHDLVNSADVAEEIVRILGIDHIDSKPLALPEGRAATIGWRQFKAERTLAARAAAQGFHESLHFLFCEKAKAVRFGFTPLEKALEVANPITAELDTLRPTLLVNLLEAAARNRAKARPFAALFELGDVYDHTRNHGREIAFVYAGDRESAALSNHGKPAAMDLFTFARRVSAVMGEFELKTPGHPKAYLQPGQCAEVYQGGQKTGELGKLHPALAHLYDLQDAFVARFDLAQCLERIPEAKPYSKLQPLSRDLTVVIEKTHRFGLIKQAVMSLNLPYLSALRAIDIYEDEKLGEKMSLTVRLQLQPQEKTLTDQEIAAVVQSVLETLQNRFGAVLR